MKQSSLKLKAKQSKDLPPQYLDAKFIDGEKTWASTWDEVRHARQSSLELLIQESGMKSGIVKRFKGRNAEYSEYPFGEV